MTERIHIQRETTKNDQKWLQQTNITKLTNESKLTNIPKVTKKTSAGELLKTDEQPKTDGQLELVNIQKRRNSTRWKTKSSQKITKQSSTASIQIPKSDKQTAQ